MRAEKGNFDGWIAGNDCPGEVTAREAAIGLSLKNEVLLGCLPSRNRATLTATVKY